MARRPAPLSPHLGIYRPLSGAFTSIAHRAVNTALFGGCFFLAAWLIGIAAGGPLFEVYTAFWGTWLGQLMLVGWTYCAFYCAAHWVRHFAWDLGYGFELPTAQLTARVALIGSAAATLAVWEFIGLRGAA